MISNKFLVETAIKASRIKIYLVSEVFALSCVNIALGQEVHPPPTLLGLPSVHTQCLLTLLDIPIRCHQLLKLRHWHPSLPRYVFS